MLLHVLICTAHQSETGPSSQTPNKALSQKDAGKKNFPSVVSGTWGHLCVARELEDLQALEGGEALLQRLHADAPALGQVQHPAQNCLLSTSMND